MPHNHPPLCCCDHLSRGRCTSCPEHGDLATLTKAHDQLDGPPSLVPSYCPTCHQKAGRPHTEYCPNGPGTVQ